MEAVRWGVLGAGKHFIQRVLPPLTVSGLNRVVSVASREAARARRIAGQYGIPAAYGSYEELLADPSVEAVFIALPNHLHAEWVRRSADAGKHVLCEKPLAMDAGQAQESVDHCRRRGVCLMEAFMYRFHPQWRRARQLVLAGEIGRLVSVDCLFAYNNTNAQNIRNILKCGGGALRDLGCYAVSIPRLLFQAEPRRVVALIDRDPAFGTDARSTAILDFGEGRAVFTVSTQAWAFQRVGVLGTAGHLDFRVPLNAFPDAPVRMTVTTGVGEREPQLPLADQYGLEFEEFARSLREGRPVPTPPEDAVANQRVLDALFASERSGGWEQV